MGHRADFVHGSNIFSLNDDRGLRLAPDFAPPGVNVASVISSGTMRNKFSGGQVTSRKYDDRGLTLSLQSISNEQSATKTHNALNDLESFLLNALMDDSEKLYFRFSPSDSVPYTPKWGQLFRNYEVKELIGSGIQRNLYLRADIKEKFVVAQIPLLVAPFATGERQQVGSATGGILEHSWATENGLSRGLIIPSLSRNEIANPIFGHTTYNTGWADGADLTDIENTDKKYILFGSSSAKLHATGSANNYYRAMVTAVDTSTQTMSVYCKRSDNGVVDGNVVTLEYATAAVTENYQAVGDGWYRVWANVTGVAASEEFDIYVADEYTIFVDGVQFEDTGFPTPLIYGDLLDCAWVSTAHNSDSTRTSAKWSIAANNLFSVEQGTITIDWMADHASASRGGDGYIFYIGANFYLRWDAGTTEWIFATSATEVSTTSGASYSAGDIIQFTCVYGPGRTELYINGSAVNTLDTAYSPNTARTTFYLGSTSTPNQYGWGTFLSLFVVDEMLTAAEVSNHYTNTSQYTTGGDGFGQCLNPIPWLWTDDGDDTVDNCYDGERENWCVAGGVPGNVQAKTEWFLDIDDAAFADDEALYLSVQPSSYSNSISKNTDLFTDHAGVADGGSCGGEYLNRSVDSTTEAFSGGMDLDLYDQQGDDYYVYIRCIDAGANLQIRLKAIEGLVTTYASDWQDVVPDAATFKAFLLGPINISYEQFSPDLLLSAGGIICGLLRTTGGASNVGIDYVAAIRNPLKIFMDTSMSSRAFLIIDKTARRVTNTKSGGAYISHDTPQITGKTQNLAVNVFNFVWSFIGDNTNANVITRTLKYTIHVTPRWSLL